MKTLERIRQVCSLFSGKRLGFQGEREWLSLVESELGHREILDHPARLAPGSRMQAAAPAEIYHVCASNLDVSAEMSLALGLVLGSRLVFKIPSSGLPHFEQLALQAGRFFDLPVTLLREHDRERMRDADAVVVFGSDETVETIRAQTLARQRFLAYGNKISAGLILAGTAGPELAGKAAREVVAYGQMGCLSPQAYLCQDFGEAEAFAEMLAAALEEEEKIRPSLVRGFEEEGLVFEARQRALLRGNRLWGVEGHRPWTVVLRQDGFLEAGPGHRFIQVIPGSDWQNILKPWKGKVSSLSLSDMKDISSLLLPARNLGISRLCALGQLQEPVLSWRHDGRPRLADLVTWMTVEESSEP